MCPITLPTLAQLRDFAEIRRQSGHSVVRGETVLPPHGAWVFDKNPAIIPASQTTANLYFCVFLSEYKCNVEFF